MSKKWSLVVVVAVVSVGEKGLNKFSRDLGERNLRLSGLVLAFFLSHWGIPVPVPPAKGGGGGS